MYIYTIYMYIFIWYVPYCKEKIRKIVSMDNYMYDTMVSG